VAYREAVSAKAALALSPKGIRGPYETGCSILLLQSSSSLAIARRRGYNAVVLRLLKLS